MTGAAPATSTGRIRLAVRIAATAWLILFLELALIRFLAGYVRLFAFYTNFVIIAAFLGMGTGILRQRIASRLRWVFPVTLVALVALVAFLASTTINVRQDGLDWLWGVEAIAETGRRMPLSVAVTLLFAVTTTLFIPLGALLGEAMSRWRALPAYAADLAGSLLGVVSFAVVSALSLSPTVWFSCAAPVWLALAWPSRRLLFGSAVALGGVVATAAWLGSRTPETWSPYYRITTQPAPEYPGSTQIDVNGAMHQVMLDFSAGATVARVDSVRQEYQRPYQMMPVPDTALVVGAGTGNDIAILLAMGVKHIDAVEIDPVIARIGRASHPLRPYDDPRVHLTITDARAYLRSPPHHYDLITFGTLDSQTLLGGMSSVRLDNYVYTQESFRAARAALRPGGSLVLYHLSGLWFIAARLYQNLDAAFDAPPRVLAASTYLFNYTFVAGAAATGATLVPADDPLRMKLKLSTDDWPFPYLRGRRLPMHYAVGLGAVLVLGAAFVTLGAGKAALAKPNWPLFLIGTGFLLLETKGITTMSLLFGSTWTVNAAVIASILAVALVAALATDRGRAPPMGVALAALTVLLVGSVLLNPAMLVSVSPLMRWGVAALYVGLPILFASFIFSTAYARQSNPTAALAFNILGAVAGGVLEYSSMALGLDALNWIVLGAYGGALLLLRRENRANPVPLAATESVAR